MEAYIPDYFFFDTQLRAGVKGRLDAKYNLIGDASPIKSRNLFSGLFSTYYLSLERPSYRLEPQTLS